MNFQYFFANNASKADKIYNCTINIFIGCAIYCVMSNWIEKYELLIRTPQCNNDEPPFIYFNKVAGFNFNNTLQCNVLS